MNCNNTIAAAIAAVTAAAIPFVFVQLSAWTGNWGFENLPCTATYCPVIARIKLAQADVAGLGGPDLGQTLRNLAAPLEIPPLAPIPEDHVLTRSFYILEDFPGRWQGNPVWVEAPPAGAEAAEGVPFRQLNDGVSPVVIGGNSWAEAWAVDGNGYPVFPVGRGWEGERRREMAYRFGINLIMYVLTGNYKSDQVHVPALLDRLRGVDPGRLLP